MKDPLGLYGIGFGRRRESRRSIIGACEKASSDDASPLLARRNLRAPADQPERRAGGDPQAQDPVGRAGQPATAPARARPSPATRSTPLDAQPAASTSAARAGGKAFEENAFETAFARAVVARPRRFEHARSRASHLVFRICAREDKGIKGTRHRRVRFSVTRRRENRGVDDASPATARPRVNPPRLRRARDDHAAGDAKNDKRRSASSSSPQVQTATTTSRRALRYRHKTVRCTREPSLKTKMRRPRTPSPRGARRRRWRWKRIPLPRNCLPKRFRRRTDRRRRRGRRALFGPLL